MSIAQSSNQTTYPTTSPYYATSVVNNKYLDLLEFRPIPLNPTDVYMNITITYQYRPDLLAFDLYNDPKLWWVFAARNPNTLGPDPYFNFTAGTGIYIPTLSTLRAVLGV
jgi:hypothetical protein